MLSLGKTAGTRGSPQHKILPGFDFSAVVPVNRRFGFTLSAATSPMYTPLALMDATWTGASAPSNGAALPDTTPDKPYLSVFSVRDARKKKKKPVPVIIRSSLWICTVAFTVNYAIFDWQSNDRQINFTMTRVLPGDFGPTFTHSAPGGGTLLTFNAAQDVRDQLIMPTLVYRHNGTTWKSEAGAGLSHSQRLRRDISKGFFANTLANRTNVTLAFDNIAYDGPGSITVRDGTTNAPLDPYRLDTYSLLQMTTNEIDTTDEQRSAYANIRRDLPTRLPITLKAGVDVRQQIRDVRTDVPTYPYVGPDGVAGGTDQNAAPMVDEDFSRRDGPYYFGPIQWLSSEKVGALRKSNPNYFGAPNAAARHNGITAASKYARERISAGYFRADVHLLDGKLRLVGGVRAEQTTVTGQGDLIDLTRNFRRDANGRVILTNGQPTNIATDPAQIANLTHLERGLRADKEYFRWFPSLNASYNLRENLIARAGYYKLDRPARLRAICRRPHPAEHRGPPSPSNGIAVNNVAIKPWMAETEKVAVEYYFKRSA